MATKKDSQPEVTHEWTPDGGLQPIGAPGTSGPATVSFFEDDEGDHLYSCTVHLHGKEIKIRELSESELAAFYRDFQASQERLAAASNPPADASPEEQESALQAATAAQMGVYEGVIDRCVKAWALTTPSGAPVPCTSETRKKLHRSHKADLCQLIVARSALGRDQSAPLSGR